jgi:putative redox protein
MIRTSSLTQFYTTKVMSDRHEMIADAPIEKGGGGAGFGAHELLEAALAVCINMAVRMYATEHAIPLSAVSTQVSLDKTEVGTVYFDYALRLQGALTAEQRRELENAAAQCPVRQTLSRQIQFRAVEA